MISLSLVRKKEKELASSYEKLHILNKKKTLSEERTRIMREVHDGFGAHVVGALVMLDTEKVNLKKLSDFLKSSLMDLRIMIDALDPNMHEISLALAMLRTRVEPILKNKNILLDWDLCNLPDDLVFNQNKTLSLLRVLQAPLLFASGPSGPLSLGWRRCILGDESDIPSVSLGPMCPLSP